MSVESLVPYYCVHTTLVDTEQTQILNISNKKGEHFLMKTVTPSGVSGMHNLELAYELELNNSLDIDAVNPTLFLMISDENSSLLLKHFPGKSLSELITDNQCSLESKKYLLMSLAEALHSLHITGYCLQNLNPTSFLINQSGSKFETKIIDLSCAVAIDALGNKVFDQSLSNNLYFSPEQTGRVNRVLDFRTDLYSLGLVFYEIITGYFPFQYTSLRELVYAHVAQPVALEDIEKKDVALAMIIGQLLEKNADNRFSSCSTLIKSLQHAIKFPGTIPVAEDNWMDENPQLSQKLYGREKQVETLLSVAEETVNGIHNLVLVSGYSGIGKSALIGEIQRPICQHNGYFLTGKNEQLGLNLPLSVFIQSLRALIHQKLMGSNEEIRQWKQLLTELLENNIGLVTQVFPELEQLFDDIPVVKELQGSEAQNRFINTFLTFIKACCQNDLLVALFLDDMQWADTASLMLMEKLCTDPQCKNILVICAFRDNEVDSLHPFQQSLNQLIGEKITITDIKLKPLSDSDISELIIDTFKQLNKPVKGLANIILDKTMGNPFFINQLLRDLIDNQLIYLNKPANAWDWDEETLISSGLSDDVLDLMTNKIANLSSGAQELLKLCSVLGSQFSVELLHSVAQITPVEIYQSCAECLQQRILYPIVGSANQLFMKMEGASNLQDFPELVLKFLHDKVQQAAYEQLSQVERSQTHVQIGRTLYEKYKEDQLEENLFDIVTHINLSSEHLDPEELLQFAQLNLKAGKRARGSGAYASSLSFLSSGTKMLPDSAWKTHHTLVFDLHLALLEAQYLCALYQEANQTSKLLLTCSGSLLEQVPVYINQILNSISRNDMQEAVDKAIWLVQELGFELVNAPPDEVNPKLINQSEEVNREIDYLSSLPDMHNKNAKAALKVLAIAGSPAYFADKNIFAMLCYTMVDICRSHGNSPDSAYAYAVYGLICCKTEHFEVAYSYCRLGLSMLDRYDHQEMIPQIYEIFNVHVKHWCDPLQQSLAGMHEGVLAGKRTGGIEFASYNAAFSCSYLFFCGMPLKEVISDCASYWQLLKQFNQELCITYAGIWIAFSKLFAGEISAKLPVEEPYFNQVKDLPKLKSDNNATGLFSFHQLLAQYYLLTGDFDNAFEQTQYADTYSHGVFGMRNTLENCYCQIISLAYSTHSDKPQNKKKVTTLLKQLEKWNTVSTNSEQHKLLIATSAQEFQQGNITQAVLAVEKGAEIALKNGFLNDYALAQLLRFCNYKFFSTGYIIQHCFNDVLQAFGLWGASGLSSNLIQRFPDCAHKSGYNLNKGTVSVQPRNAKGNLLKEDMQVLLDLLVDLSDQIEESTLRNKVLSVSTTFMGAQRGLLLVTPETNGELRVVGSYNAGEATSCNDVSHEEFSQNAVNICAQTKSSFNSPNAMIDRQLATDTYIISHQIKSLICIPMISKNKVLGVIYMENNLTANAFTKVQIERVTAIARQSATMLENARLYTELKIENEERRQAEAALADLNADLEERVIERTEQLQIANQELADSVIELNETQEHLIESEKMASLGALVAGVAHEVNTPIGAGLGAATYLQEVITATTTDYESNTLTKTTFDKLIRTSNESMRIVVTNLKRASELVQSFKRVAVDQTSLKIVEFELVEYVKNVLFSLRPKFKQKKIEIKYTGMGKLIVSQTAGAIAQIVTNLVVNAITHGFDGRNEGTINIDITLTGNNVLLKITDDGVGMDNHTRSNLFEPFFTTKRHQGGSGLGMHIVYNQVNNTLKGKISVISEPDIGSSFTVCFPVQLEI